MNKEWYHALEAPPLTPPDAVFAPVWTVLYVMIAAALLLWSRSRDQFLPHRTWKLIALHLLANAAWYPFFFGLRSPLLGLADLAVMWLTLLILLPRFWRESRLSFHLLLPYTFWLAFATYLNAGFWWLNR